MYTTVAKASAESLSFKPPTLERWAAIDEDEPGEFVDEQLVNEEVPTILLCDLAMPDLDGFEVLQRFRRDHSAPHSMVAVAISAHATREHRARSREAGYDEHLAKPYSIDNLIFIIKSVLRTSPVEGSH